MFNKLLSRIKADRRSVITRANSGIIITGDGNTLYQLNTQSAVVSLKPIPKPRAAEQSLKANFAYRLRWDSQLTALVGRSQELQQLKHWASNAQERISVAVLHGEGGVGKTRLALQLGQDLELDGWAVSTVDKPVELDLNGHAAAESNPQAAAGAGILLLLDYPEEQPQQLDAIIEALRPLQEHQQTQPLRLLLISRRSATFWHERLAGIAHHLSGIYLALGQLMDEQCWQLYQRAITACAGEPSVVAASFDAAAQARFICWLQANPLHNRPLFVLAHALFKDHQPGVPAPYGGELIQTIVRVYELKRISRLAVNAGLPKLSMQRLQALAALTGGMSVQQLKELSDNPIDGLSLPASPELTDQLLRSNLLSEASQQLEPLQPDILAAVLLVDQISSKHPEHEVWLAYAMLQSTDVKAFAQRYERLCHDIDVICDTPNEQRHDEAISTFESPDYLGLALRKAIQKRPELSAHAKPLLYLKENERSHWVASLAVAAGSELASVQGQSDADTATLLNNWSVNLSAAGKQAEALTAIRRAVEIRERLAQTNPVVYEPDLASSLNNLSTELSAAGEPAASLSAIRRAVEILERLAQTNPVVYEPDLAGSLANWAFQLLAAEPASAVQYLQRAQALLSKHAKPNTQYAQWLAQIEAVLAQLQANG